MPQHPNQNQSSDANSVRLLTREEAEREDRTYWLSKTPDERLAALEQLRQIAYGYNPITDRIQPIVEYFQRQES